MGAMQETLEEPVPPGLQLFHFRSELLLSTRARIGTMLPAAQKD